MLDNYNSDYLNSLVCTTSYSVNCNSDCLNYIHYLQEEPVWRPDAHPGLVAVPAHELERLQGARRGGRRDDSAGDVDAHELVAEHAEVERRLINPP